VLLGVFLLKRADVDFALFTVAARLIRVGGAVEAPVVGHFGSVGILGNDHPALGKLGGAFQQA
jgi:hypothetical protein